MANANEIVQFWRDAGPNLWFLKDEAFDERCREFEAEHHAAARRELADWENDAEGALALVLLLDQFPRNMFRNNPHAFATDSLAQGVATRAIERGFDTETAVSLRAFFYLPYEHAEDMGMQTRAVELIQQLGDAEFTRYAIIHRDLIARFGRFPHRNAILDRPSTPEEVQFLAEGGFAG